MFLKLSQPNSTSTQVESDKVIGWSTPPQATHEADFEYETLFQPNQKKYEEKRLVPSQQIEPPPSPPGLFPFNFTYKQLHLQFHSFNIDVF